MRTHTPTSDKQLWKTLEDAGRVWPVYATPSVVDGPCYFVESAATIETEEQWKFVNHWLSSQAFDSDGTHWLIRPKNFEQLHRKCDGVTPGYYLQWPGVVDVNLPQKEADVSNITNPVQNDEISDFIRYCCAENGWPNFHVINGMFALICRSANHWMLAKRKPLDLGFCTIYALPYRKNWQAVVDENAKKKWPNIASILKRKKHRMGILDACGFIPMLHDTDLLAISDDETLTWSLSIIEGKQFKRLSEKMERDTLKESTAARYVGRIGSLIKKSYANIVEITADYFEKANAPVGYVDTTLPQNSWRVSRKVPYNRNRPSVDQGVQDDAADAPVEATTQLPGAGEVDAGKAQDLPILPAA